MGCLVMRERAMAGWRYVSSEPCPSVYVRLLKQWWQVWNEFQKRLPKHKRSTVIYGHDSKRGLQMEKYSMGIDTGCLKGGKLSAIVIEGGQSDHKHKLVQVDCKDGRQK